MAMPVEGVWVWRFTLAPFRATYGRLPGNTYTKDFLQASGDCARMLDLALQRSAGSRKDVLFVWPGGSRTGSLFEAADYSQNGRVNLRWETSKPPAPWRLYASDDPSALKTFLGNPNHQTPQEANREWRLFEERDFGPWLVVVKLRGDPDQLHVRAYLDRPPQILAFASTSSLPNKIRRVMEGVPRRGGCGAFYEAPETDRGPREKIYFEPSAVHNAWSLGEPSVPTDVAPTARRRPTNRELGVRYRRENLSVVTSHTLVFFRDPDQVDRGLRAHKITQEALAEAVETAKLLPMSSSAPGCDYDVAWVRNGVVFVAEVKSLTGQNERQQLRLGLGQVLDYGYRLETEGWRVQAVLCVERRPADEFWMQICAQHNVRLVWPGILEELFT